MFTYKKLPFLIIDIAFVDYFNVRHFREHDFCKALFEIFLKIWWEIREIFCFRLVYFENQPMKNFAGIYIFASQLKNLFFCRNLTSRMRFQFAKIAKIFGC